MNRERERRRAGEWSDRRVIVGCLERIDFFLSYWLAACYTQLKFYSINGI